MTTAQTGPFGPLKTSLPRTATTDRLDRGALLAKLGAAAAATVLLATLVGLTMARDSWLRTFLFERGPIQWAIVLGAFLGLIELVLLHIGIRRETLDVDRWENEGDPGAGAGHLASARARLQAALSRPATTDLRSALSQITTELSEAASNRFALIETLVYVMPFVGLVGTLSGMSGGLRASFGAAGALDVAPFRTALSSSLENSFAAIAVTVLLVLVKQALQVRSGTVVTRAERIVTDELHQHAWGTPAGSVDGALSVLANSVRASGNELRSLAGSTATLSTGLSAVLDTVKAHQQATRESNEQLAKSSAALAAAAKELGAHWVNVQAGATTQTAQFQALTRQLNQIAEQLQRLQQSASRPRTFVELPESK